MSLPTPTAWHKALMRLWPAALTLLIFTPPSWAAEPLTYAVTIAPTGDAVVDSNAPQVATLVTLREKAPVGAFALIARARADVGQLTDVLHSRGYYLGSVAVTIAGRPLDDAGLASLLTAAPAAPPVPVAVTMTLGRPFTVGRVQLHGDVPKNAVALLGLKSGDPARAADVLAAGNRLLTGLEADGRALAKVQPPVATLAIATATLDVSFQVEAGPQVDLGHITFAGDTQVHHSYLRRRFGLTPGERYDPAAIERARADMLAVPALASVRIDTPGPLDTDGRLPVLVTVADRPRHAVDLTASYSTDQGGLLSASWTHRNLFGHAESLQLSAAATQIGGTASRQPGYNVGAILTVPDFLQRSQNLIVSAQAIKESLQAYDRTAALSGIKLERKITDQITLGGGVSGEVAQITQEDVQRTYKLVQLPLSAAYDSSNSVLDPTRGLRMTLLVTPTHSLGSSTTKTSTFTISQASAATYLDVGALLGEGDGRSVLAVRGLVGSISGADLFDIPPDQRFYAGGGGTVRGYRFQSVGPAFADRTPAGGTTVQVGSAEWRQRFGSSFGAVVFVDGGEVNGGDNTLSGSNVLRVGAGTGFRYYTSFGPIRVDIAVPLNKSGTIKTDIVEAYIGIGQAF